MMEKVILDDGKYELQADDGMGFKCLRNGREWRDLVGDGMVLAMFYEILQLKEDIRELKGEAE